MLHPNQFEVNEAWIVFQLNDEPLLTEIDGALNCFALMDAASCYILGAEFVRTDSVEPLLTASRLLLEKARSNKPQWPRTLFITRDQVTDALSREAMWQEIDVVTIPESELRVFIDEAREAFREQFGVRSS